MSKIGKILNDHKMSAEYIYISVPSYLSQYERKIIKKCAEISQVAR
jgi:hypothetical protein